jgi:choice-of-anchor C domain-containing protein
MSRLLSALVAVALVAGLAASAEASLIVNGSFENADVGGNEVPAGSFSNGFETLDAGSTAIYGWTVTNNSIDWIAGYWKAADGNYSLDMGGTLNSGDLTNAAGTLVSQRFATTPGTWYRVQFDMSGNPDGGPATKTMDATVSGSMGEGGITEQDFSYTLDTLGTNSHSAMYWETKALWFEALADQATLTFASTTFTPSAGQYGPALDNVQVDAVVGDGSNSILVPEPATVVVWSLLGVAAVGLALRRRR